MGESGFFSSSSSSRSLLDISLRFRVVAAERFTGRGLSLPLSSDVAVYLFR